MVKSLQKLSWWLMVVLLIGTPLHGFLSTVLLYKFELVNFSGLSLVIAAWKELLIGLLTVLAVALAIFKKQRMNSIQWLIIGFVVVGLVVSLTNWQQLSLEQLIWGARTEWTFLLLLFGLLFLIKEWSTNQINRLVKIAIGTGVVVLAWGLFVQLVGYEFLVNLGYRNDWSTFYLDQAPAFCQREGGTEFCRMQSTFVGPNRYAGYLLVLLPLLWFWGKKTWQKVVLVGAGLVSLILTLSSTAWLALIVTIGVYLVWKYQDVIFKHWKWLVGALAVSFIVGLGVLLEGTLLFSLHVYLDASGSEHLVRTFAALDKFINYPFGLGLGEAGPASFKVGKDFIPENWFLQVAINTGIFGLLLFVGIWGETFRKISDKCQQKVTKWQLIGGLALIAVLFQNLFLHTLEDPGVYVILIFVLILALKPVYAAKIG